MRIGRARIWDSQGLARIWDLGRVLAGIWGGPGWDLGWSWLGSGEGPILREGVEIWGLESKFGLK